jgi:hypothetical protein
MRKSFSIIPLITVVYFALTTILLGQTTDQIKGLYDQIKNVSLDEQEVAEVESLVLKRDVATFRLNKGKIFFFNRFRGGSLVQFLSEKVLLSLPHPQKLRNISSKDSPSSKISAKSLLNYVFCLRIRLTWSLSMV